MKQQIRLCTTADGVRVAYATCGKGPPLVKTANWLTHLELERTSPACRHWLAAHARSNTLVRYDPRGSGLSDRDVGELDLETWVRDLEAVVDAAGLERFALIGGCQGCAVAVAYAARHPERVSRLVLYGGYVRGAYTAGMEPQAQETARTLQKVIEMGWGSPAPAFRQLFSGLLMPRGSGEEVAALTELAHHSTSAANAARFWEAFHRFDVEEPARRIRAPTLVLHVRRDAMVPFDMGRHLASLIPGARFVPLEGANHILLERDAAWKQYLEEVEPFLAEEESLAPDGKAAFDAEGLTRRELQILDHLARGLSNDEIAAALSISPRTVRNHVTSIFGKLAVVRRSQAIVRAREAGLGRGLSSAV